MDTFTVGTRSIQYTLEACGVGLWCLYYSSHQYMHGYFLLHGCRDREAAEAKAHAVLASVAEALYTAKRKDCP